VVVCRESVARLLLLFAQGKKQSDRLFSFTVTEYRSLFKAACATLGLQGHYLPHSLRGGGATHDFLAMGESNMHYIMLRGRWTSEMSLFTYCRAGKSILLACQEPPDIIDIGKRLDCCLFSSMRKACRLS
jgi:hypothetical protein